jgi:hypothetical protein
MLTRYRLVVTAKSRLTRRVRLHLSLDLDHLGDVTWTPEPTLGGVRLDVTAVDGIREHFWIESPDVARVGELLDRVFNVKASGVNTTLAA